MVDPRDDQVGPARQKIFQEERNVDTVCRRAVDCPHMLLHFVKAKRMVERNRVAFRALLGLGRDGVHVGKRGERFAQRVFAATAWTAYVPSWDTELVTPDFVRINHRPPSNRGATLGGVERLRGYPRGRFNDKAAIYYGAELRLIPRWDPFRTWPFIRNSPWRWWQIVGFVEVGRVAPSWHIGDLHEDLKWSAGAGLRFMIGSGILRLDFATSEENTQWWVMARQAF